jgi:hypothetical protein
MQQYAIANQPTNIQNTPQKVATHYRQVLS